MRKVLGYLPDRIAEGLGKLAGLQDLSAAVEKLGREPIFCMETGTAWGGTAWGRAAAAILVGAASWRSSGLFRLPAPLPGLPTAHSLGRTAAVRLFFWMRLSYREEEEVMGHPFINAPAAMRLFGVTHFETIWDDTTDTHCVLGWSETQVVLAFRWALHTCSAGVLAAGHWLCSAVRGLLVGFNSNGTSIPMALHAHSTTQHLPPACLPHVCGKHTMG